MRVNERILKLTGMLGGQQAVGIVCSIVRTKLVALWIGPAGVGLFGIFNSALDMVSGVSQLGMRDTAVRHIAASHGEDVPAMVWSVRRVALALGIVGAVAMLALSPWLSRVSFGSSDGWSSFAWLSLSVLLLTLSNAEGAVLQGLQRFRKLTKCSVAGTIAATAVSVPMFYFWRVNSIIPAILAFSVVTWIAMGFVRERVDYPDRSRRGWRQAFAAGKQFMLLGFYITLTNLVGYAVNYLFLAYLNHYASLDAAGFYNAGFSLINRYAGLIFAAIAMEFFPRLSSVTGRTRAESVFVSNQIGITLAIIVPLACVFTTLIQPAVRLLYTSEFVDSVVPMVVLAMAGTAFKAVSWCMAFVIVARADGRTFLVTETLSALVAIAFNIIGFRIGGFAGLGVAYTAWYAVYTLMIAVVYFRRYHLQVDRSVWTLAAYAVAVTAVSGVIAVTVGPLWTAPLAVLSSVVSVVMLRRMLKNRKR